MYWVEEHSTQRIPSSLLLSAYFDGKGGVAAPNPRCTLGYAPTLGDTTLTPFEVAFDVIQKAAHVIHRDDAVRLGIWVRFRDLRNRCDRGAVGFSTSASLRHVQQ